MHEYRIAQGKKGHYHLNNNWSWTAMQSVRSTKMAFTDNAIFPDGINTTVRDKNTKGGTQFIIPRGPCRQGMGGGGVGWDNINIKLW